LIPIAIDFETFYSSKLKYTIKGTTPRNYADDQNFDPYLLSFATGEQAWCGSRRDFSDCGRKQSLVTGNLALAHNAAFDSAVWTEAQKRKLIPVSCTPSGWLCTADLTSYLCNRRALSDAMLYFYEESVSKQVRSDADNKHWPADFTQQEQKDMIAYGGGDAVSCLRLWNDHSAKWPEKERRLSILTREQGYRGVRLNVQLLNEYIGQTHEMLKATENLIPWIKDTDDESWDKLGVERKPTSTKMIAEQCRKSKIPCPPVKSHFDDGEERYEEWVQNYIKANPWIAALTTWRSIGKVHKTFVKMKGRLFGDIMPFGLKYWGAHTGRWSGDAGINMQNLRKDPILADQNSLMANDAQSKSAYECFDKTGKWPEWVRFVIDIRKLIIPREGKKMIICDLSQIEARITRWFAGDHEILKAVAGGMSIYTAHARATLGWTGGNELKTQNKEMYALAKARELALGFGCGHKKFINMAMTLAGVDITKDDPEWIEYKDQMTGKVTKVSGYGRRSKLEVEDYRAKNLGVVNFWNQLNDGLRASVGEDMELELPSGRSLNYKGVRRSMKIVKNEETGKPEQRWEITAEVGGDREHYYGGKLAENMVQATARDVFGEHLLAIDGAGMDTLFTAHDEAVLEVELDVTPRDVEHLMSKTPDWLSGCPVGAEAQEVLHYKK
jgi:hypothetical protein